MSTSGEKHILSKSTFMRGCQCTKALYLNKHQPQLRAQITGTQQALFDRGTDVGELARGLFPDGVDATPEFYYDYAQSVSVTRQLMAQGRTVIYEAAFQWEGVLAILDILVMEDGQWKGFEVKSTTSLKQSHVLDAALQYHVISKAGVALENVSIVYLNNAYVRQGDLDLHQLFKVESILEDVLERQDFIARQITTLKGVIAQPDVPAVAIGPHCAQPYPCDFIHHCWKDIPTPSVFDISRLSVKKQFELYEKGIVRFEDITEAVELNDHQRMQINCHLSKTDHVDHPAIRQFLSTLSYPLYFLDFETFNPAVPLFDNARPYQQIPFQYSIHYKKNRHAELRHTEFLATATGDPRPGFLHQLLSKTRMPGSILTYNQQFEKSILYGLARDFPNYADEVEERVGRIKDLMPPFRQRFYYTHLMNGAYSIKDVLPALVPGLVYDNLPINNGADASLYFEQMIYRFNADNDAIRRDLLSYCKLDTLAMVKILEHLEAVI